MNKSTPRIRKQHLFGVLLLCSCIVTGLLLGEIVLRLAAPVSYYIWTPHLEMLFKPDQDIMPGISEQSRFAVNSDGIRGDELTPSHTYRILALGGSTTLCLYLDQYETWPHLLQKKLTENTSHIVWVGNAGMSGRTTAHHLTAMQYLPLEELKIDVVILLIGANDFLKRLAQDEISDANFLMKPEAATILLDQTFTGGSHPYQDDPFFKKTAVWQNLRKVKRVVLKENPQIPDNVQDESGKYFVTRRTRRQQAEVRNELPDLSSALQVYATSINKMIDIAQEKSIRLIFLTHPTMWKPTMSKELEALLWLGWSKDLHVFYSSEALKEGMDKYNHTLLKICRERGVECIDLSSFLEKDTTVFYDDDHFNESGSKKVSTILSNYILNQGSTRKSIAAK